MPKYQWARQVRLKTMLGLSRLHKHLSSKIYEAQKEIDKIEDCE